MFISESLTCPRDELLRNLTSCFPLYKLLYEMDENTRKMEEALARMQQTVKQTAEKVDKLHDIVDYEKRFKEIVKEGLTKHKHEFNRLMNQVLMYNAYMFAYTEPNSMEKIVIYGPCFLGHEIAKKVKTYLYSSLETDPKDVESEFIFDLNEEESKKFGHLIDNYDYNLKEYMQMSQYKIKEEGYSDIDLMEALHAYANDKFSFNYGSTSTLITPLKI